MTAQKTQCQQKEQQYTRWVALMIQLEQQQHGEFVVGWWWGGWLTPTTYIQLAGAGSKMLKRGPMTKLSWF